MTVRLYVVRAVANKIIRQGGAVGGDYAITGTLPTVDDVIAFKEGTAEFDHGYYRFVSHPRVRRLKDTLKKRFGCRHCTLTESVEVALLELILCLRKPGAPCRIVVQETGGGHWPFADASFLPACEREGVALLTEIPPDISRDDLLVISGSPAGSAGTAETARSVEAAQARGVTVIGLAASAGSELPAPAAASGVRFHVVGLLGVQEGVHGGAVLGNADRPMDRLTQQVRRRGPILSSRAADVLLGSNPAPDPDDSAAVARVAEALCRLEGGSQAFLYCSGMSAVTRVLDVLRRPGRSRIVAVGHLYNDTYQTLRLGSNAFLGVDEMDKLDELVDDHTAAILTETITNPLSDVPDLDLLSRAARAHGVPLVVDNTIATPANCRPFDFGADYVIHSTTKYLNGRNDHGGGAVIVRDPARAGALASCQALLDDRMFCLEAAALEKNLPSFPARMGRFNENAERVAAFLAGHPCVARVFFNGLKSHRSYLTARRLLQGPGSVISFVLARDTWEGLRAFYDSRLSGIVKAPSLGSDVTLLCPYTLLTHYDDTDEVLSEIGLPRFLIRIAVGCETDISLVLESLDAALSSCREP
jgi:cystathionine beta-lyase/cystathionine gamma-synthase